MKKILIIVVILAIVGAGAYFLFLKDQGDDQKTELYNYAIKDAFITNVKDSNKLFKTQIVIVADEKGLEDTVEENLYTIRDTVLFIFRDLTEEDIKSMDIQDKLRAVIPEALNKALEADYVVSVYFSDFVMQ